jgi:very-short-patch-repair endonuclease
MDSLRSQYLEQAEYDIERTRYLESQGYKVVCFWNNDVMSDINGVFQAIEIALGND